MLFKNRILLISCLIAFVVWGCALPENSNDRPGSSLNPPTQSEIAILMEYAAMSEHIEIRDPGLLLGIKNTPLINLSDIKNDVTFTVHQIIADATRTILIFSFQLPETNEQGENSGRSRERINLNGFNANLTRYNLISDTYVAGVAYFNSPLYSGTTSVTVTAENLDGVVNDSWSVEVPITFMEDIEGREVVSHKQLETELAGLKFTVAGVTLGSTATTVDWAFAEQTDSSGERDYTIAKNLYYDYGAFLNIPFGNGGFPNFILKQSWQNVYLENERREKIVSFDRSVPSRPFFPPMKAEQQLKVILSDVLLQKKEPVSLHLQKGPQGVSSPFSKAGTTVKVEEVQLGARTGIKLCYQYGNLGEMMEPYLLDSAGNRYQLEKMELQIPAYDELMAQLENLNSSVSVDVATDITKLINEYNESLNQFSDNFQEQKKYQLLYFPAMAEGVEELTLAFDVVVYLSDLEWGISIGR